MQVCVIGAMRPCQHCNSEIFRFTAARESPVNFLRLGAATAICFDAALQMQTASTQQLVLALIFVMFSLCNSSLS